MKVGEGSQQKEGKDIRCRNRIWDINLPLAWLLQPSGPSIPLSFQGHLQQFVNRVISIFHRKQSQIKNKREKRFSVSWEKPWLFLLWNREKFLSFIILGKGTWRGRSKGQPRTWDPMGIAYLCHSQSHKSTVTKLQKSERYSLELDHFLTQSQIRAEHSCNSWEAENARHNQKVWLSPESMTLGHGTVDRLAKVGWRWVLGWRMVEADHMLCRDPWKATLILWPAQVRFQSPHRFFKPSSVWLCCSLQSLWSPPWCPTPPSPQKQITLQLWFTCTRLGEDPFFLLLPNLPSN